MRAKSSHVRGEIVGSQHKPVAGFGLEHILHGVDDLRRLADHHVAMSGSAYDGREATRLTHSGSSARFSGGPVVTLLANDFDLEADGGFRWSAFIAIAADSDESRPRLSMISPWSRHDVAPGAEAVLELNSSCADGAITGPRQYRSPPYPLS